MKAMIFVLSLFFLLFSPEAPAFAEISVRSPAHILEQIELRRGLWMGIEADLLLQFSSSGRSASCQGRLVYDRLREKVTLDCRNLKNELLFTYKTLDLNFELYLPGQQKVIRGNIFDLQFDPDVELHLLPQDLYRALKPLLIEPGQARVTDWNEETLKLSVVKPGEDGGPYLARTLVVTKQGDVPEETFYTAGEVPHVRIRRRDFSDFKMADLKRRVSYPRVTEIQSLTDAHKTTLILREARFFLNPQE